MTDDRARRSAAHSLPVLTDGASLDCATRLRPIRSSSRAACVPVAEPSGHWEYVLLHFANAFAGSAWRDSGGALRSDARERSSVTFDVTLRYDDSPRERSFPITRRRRTPTSSFRRLVTHAVSHETPAATLLASRHNLRCSPRYACRNAPPDALRVAMPCHAGNSG